MCMYVCVYVCKLDADVLNAAKSSSCCACCFEQKSSSQHIRHMPVAKLTMDADDDDDDNEASINSVDFYADITMRTSGSKKR